jgi:HEAT repeat protein
VACYAVRDLGDVRAVQPLIERLRDSNKFVRQCAAEALGEIGDPRAIEPLKARLDTEEDEQVRNSIKRALRFSEK